MTVAASVLGMARRFAPRAAVTLTSASVAGLLGRIGEKQRHCIADGEQSGVARLQAVQRHKRERARAPSPRSRSSLLTLSQSMAVMAMDVARFSKSAAGFRPPPQDGRYRVVDPGRAFLLPAPQQRSVRLASASFCSAGQSIVLRQRPLASSNTIRSGASHRLMRLPPVCEITALSLRQAEQLSWAPLVAAGAQISSFPIPGFQQTQAGSRSPSAGFCPRHKCMALG